MFPFPYSGIDIRFVSRSFSPLRDIIFFLCFGVYIHKVPSFSYLDLYGFESLRKSM